jgi:hypothetical protein
MSQQLMKKKSLRLLKLSLKVIEEYSKRKMRERDLVDKTRFKKIKSVRETAFRHMMRLTFKSLYRIAKDEMQEI